METNVRNLTDDALVKRSLKNDNEAGKELFVRHALFLYRLAYRTTLNQAIAEEVSQEAWLKIFQKMEQYQDGTSFKSWAASICYNLCVDHVRKAHRQQNLDLTALKQMLYPARLIPAEYAERNEWMEKILRFIQTMPDVFRTALTLRYMEDLSYKDIAAIMDCPEKTARTRVHRATESLRGQFGS